MSLRERQAQFEELTLLQTQGSKLCHAIVSPPWSRHHLSEGMQLATLRHTEMAGELAAFLVAVSSATELVLRCSPSDTSRVEVEGELATEFQKVKDRCSQLERSAVRICALLLGPPPAQARLANHLGEALGWLRVELATQRGRM
jgi:hypothetical protein